MPLTLDRTRGKATIPGPVLGSPWFNTLEGCFLPAVILGLMAHTKDWPRLLKLWVLLTVTDTTVRIWVEYKVNPDSGTDDDDDNDGGEDDDDDDERGRTEE